MMILSTQKWPFETYKPVKIDERKFKLFFPQFIMRQAGIFELKELVLASILPYCTSCSAINSD